MQQQQRRQGDGQQHQGEDDGGVRVALEREGFRVVAEVPDADGAIAAAVEHAPDVCLLDIHMPGNGIRAAAEITQRASSTAVVMLTVSRDDADLFEALRAGAAGYLLKDIDPDRLPNALKGVLEGEAAIPRSLVARLLDDFRDRGGRRRKVVGDDLVSQLTSREWEVLDLMRRGLGTNEIATRLTLSHVTVRTHIAAILRKLRVPDREAAVKLVEQSDRN